MIDAHIHFWDAARGDDILIVRREPSLAQAFMPADLLPLMAACDVREAVAIQSAPQPAETEHLLATSEPIDAVKAVVGWTDLAAPDAAARIAALSRRPKLTGVRAMLHRLDDPHWLIKAEVRPGLRALAAAGMSLDVTARAEHVCAIAVIAASLPELRIIVDHGATAPIRSGDLSHWIAAISTLTPFPQVTTKFSGLVEEAPEDWDASLLEPAARALLDAFGPHRLMWASNWPVVNLRGGYKRWMDASMTLLDRLRLSSEERSAIEQDTARRVYRLATQP